MAKKNTTSKPTHFALVKDNRYDPENKEQKMYDLRVASGWQTEGGAIRFACNHNIAVNLADVVIVPAKEDE